VRKENRLKFQIKAPWSADVKFECGLSAQVAGLSYGLQLGFAIKKAIAEGVNLSGSDLSDSDLSGSDLRGSNLRDSNLRGSNLSDSDLSGSDLSGSNLRGSNLSGSDLSGSNLSGSNLSGSNLSGSDLSDSNLSGSDLRGSDLSDSNLSGSDLRGSNLSGSNLRGSNLRPIRDDLWAVLSAAPLEVDGLRAALAGGRIDGSTYNGDCACLVGTIAKVRGVDFNTLPGLAPDSSRPSERFFLGINKGDTPETNEVSKIALAWCDEWVGNMRAAFGPKS
jgi:uncharacterized protein YjbI with pentapeptide repeats